MACFLAPATEAIIMTIVKKHIEKKEKLSSKMNEESVALLKSKTSLPLSRKLSLLTNMLWGGSALLFVEHIWHGEIVPWFPFLTAMKTPESAYAMLLEIAAVGVAMALAVTAVWGVMMLALHILEKNGDKLAFLTSAEEK